MKSHLSPLTFYGTIVAGLLLGIVVCVTAGWVYLTFSDTKPTGRRIWDGIADEFVIPLCVMMGSTFGGLAGVGVAVVLERHVVKSSSRKS